MAIAGIDNMKIGDTVSDNENPLPLPRIYVDEPTVAMIFYVNTSPFSGRDGKFLTSRQIHARLLKEVETDVAALVEQVSDMDDFVLQFDDTDDGKRFIEAWKRARIIPVKEHIPLPGKGTSK